MELKHTGVPWLILVTVTLVSLTFTSAQQDYNYGPPNDYDGGNYPKIRCFKCTSENGNVGCGDPFDETSADICRDGDACLVVTTTILGTTTVHRGCTASTSIDSVARCHKSGVEPVETQTCTCYKNLCNGAKETDSAASRVHTLLALCVSLVAALWNTRIFTL